MASVVMLLRHAEKPLNDDPPHGVTVEGKLDAESLTPRGWQRAGALVGLFVPDESAAGRVPRLPRPTHLFASQVAPGSSSQRPRETLLPLSERLGLAVDGRFRKGDLVGLAGAVEATDGIVLIAWEHHLIPTLAGMLAGNGPAMPSAWPDDRYDVIWVLERTGPGAPWAFRQVTERLLAGDREEPI